MGRPHPEHDWDGYLRFHHLGPAMLEARVGNAVVTLHTSEYNAYEWILRSPNGMSQGALDGVWEALQLGRAELLMGLLPEGAVAVEARLGENERELPVHTEAHAYWLTMPLARELTLTFRDAAGSVVWENRINAWHRAHSSPLHNRPEEFRLRLMAEYRLGEPLATVRVGDTQVSIHRQEGVPPSPFGEGEGPGEPVGTLWALQYEVREHGGGGSAGPLTLVDEEGNGVTSDPGCSYVGEEWRVFAGTVPAGAASATAVVGESGEFPVELVPEIFYVVVPSSKRATVTIKDEEGHELERHELPSWEPPWKGSPPRMDLLSWLRMTVDMYLPFARRRGYQYWYGGWGRRHSVKVPEESQTLQGMPPELRARERPSHPSLPMIVPGVALLAAGGILLWWALRHRGRAGHRGG